MLLGLVAAAHGDHGVASASFVHVWQHNAVKCGATKEFNPR
jgi:hypothetical protein